MRRIFWTVLIALMAAMTYSAPGAPQKPEGQIRIAVLDVITPDKNEMNRRIITEVFRTELFRMNMFHIVERGELASILEEHKMNLAGLTDDTRIVEIGRFLKADKMVYCRIGKVFDEKLVHCRVIDVNSSLVDYSENVFIEDDDQVYDALREISKKIEIYYMFQKPSAAVTNTDELLKRKWSMLGASEEELKVIMEKRLSPDVFLEMRQFSISFTIKNFIQAVQNNWDLDTIKNFLQAGIPFNSIERSLKLGIFELTHYRYSFKQAGYTFDEYLEAYENRIVSTNDYRRFKEGYRRDRLIVGVGGVSDMMPVSAANFSFYGGSLAWEHYWSSYQRGWFKWSTEAGLYLIKFIYPVPYLQANIYLGQYPFYTKFSAGTHVEAFLGGHAAFFLRFGMEIWETVEWNVTFVPLGTQPGVSYTDLTTRQGDADYKPIVYPYYGAFLTMKF